MGIFQKLFGRGTKQNKRPYCSAVVAAAGSSRRMNGEDKLFIEIDGKPVILHSLLAMELSPDIDEIVVVTQSESIVRIADLCKTYGLKKVSKVIVGGAERADSVYNGLSEISQTAELVAIHDGARPLVTADVIHNVVECASKYNAAAPAVPLKDTVKTAVNSVVTGTPERSTLFAVQTPQVFVPDMLKAALLNIKEKNLPITDDCMAIEAIGGTVYLSEGSYENIKITTPSDVLVAEAILSSRGDTL